MYIGMTEDNIALARNIGHSLDIDTVSLGAFVEVSVYVGELGENY